MAAESAPPQTSRWRAVTTTCGWGLVVALALLEGGGAAGTILFLSAPALCLASRRDFPQRAPGLQCSWVGPAIVLVAALAYQHSAGPSPDSIRVLASIGILQGAVVLLMIWLWRGYGIVPFLCLWGHMPRQRAVSERAAESYPWVRWWLVPVAFAALGVLQVAVLVYWLVPPLIHR